MKRKKLALFLGCVLLFSLLTASQCDCPVPETPPIQADEFVLTSVYAEYTHTTDKRLDSLENAIFDDLPEINEQQYYLMDQLDTLKWSVVALEQANQGGTVARDSVEYVDSLGISIRYIEEFSFCFKFYHDFKDVTGQYEVGIEFEIGYEEYESIQDYIDGVGGSIWQGYRTFKFKTADLQTFGEWSAKHGRRMEFQSTIYGLDVDKWYVFSTRATDDEGNQSEWLKSTDSWNSEPFIVNRIR